MYSQTRNLKIISEINVVPYIDVMLVLLIIFMVSSSSLFFKGVDVDLPNMAAESASALLKEKDVNFLVIEINQKGQLGLSVNNKKLQQDFSIESIILRVKKELLIQPSSIVVIGGDVLTPYSKIIILLEALRYAGISKVGLLTDIKE
ncbi:biopolymer transporter ExbD [Candidatus Photodesmus anomalopis]|uniref:TolR n=1 Tax=Candidatus Photodesmus katoptron Akat1 TaxID=1236703 RepID=S3DZQ0_9GAMM|nr:biopolymer transporter ExbD [Candidatus Photodesmus katoptron]EPE37426.1 TolR [Candidatus Photodesmus katoptron Akat1]